MPLSRRELIQLSLILLIVPAQYFLTKNYPTTSRSQALSDVVNSVQQFTLSVLQFESWARLCKTVTSWALNDGKLGYASDIGESPAREVLEYLSKKQQGYFASSKDPRYVRPHTLLYHVGQVVRHRDLGYRGVIAGWDTEAKAPDYWLEELKKIDRNGPTQPNYLVMVDTRDRAIPQFTYVPQDSIEVFPKNRILHPKLEDYFEHYDGAQYIPRPWLQSLYPRD